MVVTSNPFVLAVSAAGCFTLGALFMRPAAGFTRVLPSVAVALCFLAGAVANTRLVHLGGALGPAYLAVVGFETVLAFTLGAVVFGEQVTAARLVAVGLVLAGTLLLTVGELGSPAEQLARP